MHIKEELKLNRFRLVRIPTKGELFRQYGELQGQANYTGDEFAEANSGRKSDRFAASEALMREFDRKRQEEQDGKKK